ncbi:MAG: tRNA pseudouridine(38-40) synthase TruA [Methanomassiliicoccaceae archaeon]|nr:tRNA pseudouridine(38-40) synthase TruA [Methanomassiliicoccaceae archaeon]
MIRAALKVAYLGEHFSGSQRQPSLRTVEGDILSDVKAITKMSDTDIDLRLASRTDKGVNSLGNVAVFNSSIDDPDILLKALNAVSEDIFYRGAALVGGDFNPRFADVRRYRYVLRSDGMDISAMKKCAELFVGEHDFTRFCRPEQRSAILTLNSIEVNEKNGMMMLDFTARYFLWNMVRRISAAVMSVGAGDSSLSDVKDALDGKDITFGLARADALTLMDVCYKDLEFTPPTMEMFKKRTEEEMFRDMLRNTFLTSL